MRGRTGFAMVRFQDLDEDADSNEAHPPLHLHQLSIQPVIGDDSRPNPNLNTFTATLSCYP